MKRLALVFASVLAAACGDRGAGLVQPLVTTLPSGAVEVKNTGPSEWADTNGWRLVEVYRVGGSESGDPDELVHPLGVAVDQAGGIYVADMQPAVIKQFGPTGTYVRSIGHEGSGPGEFRGALAAAAPGLLVVHDPISARTSVFDSAGRFLRSWNSVCCNWTSIAVSREGVVAVPFIGHPVGGRRPGDSYYVRFLLDGSLVDTLHISGPEGIADVREWTVDVGDGQTNSVLVPLSPAVWTALDPAGGAVVGWSGAYQYYTTSTGRDTTQLVTLDASPGTATDARRAEVRDSMIDWYVERGVDRRAADEAFMLSDIPSTIPYYQSIAIDGRGNRWVRRAGGGGSGAVPFDVFDSTGAYLGAVPVPRDFGVSWRTAWGEDRVATMVETVEGLPVVVVYRIER